MYTMHLCMTQVTWWKLCGMVNVVANSQFGGFQNLVAIIVGVGGVASVGGVDCIVTKVYRLINNPLNEFYQSRLVSMRLEQL